MNPAPSNPLHYGLFLSYPLPQNDSLIPAHGLFSNETYYDKGLADFGFVAFYIVVFSFTREFLMQCIILPLAIRAGIRGKQKQHRFMEQGYTAVYFGLSGLFGLYVMSRTPVWYFNTDGMYEGFPHKSHDAIFKCYYLLQASYWAQQAGVLLLQLEKPRKDFKELVAHHIVTLALIWLSYRFHFTYMGLAVYITHDISDFFLAVSECSTSGQRSPGVLDFALMTDKCASQSSKILNYLRSPITVPYFTTFIFVWGYMRHYINLRILYSVLTTFKSIGDFELNWETQQYKCWISQYISFGLLAALQSLNMFWMYLILRIAYNILIKKEAERDVRSDDEEDEAEEEASRTEQKKVELRNLKNDVAEKKALNGKAPEGHDTYADAVVEGKKEK